MTNIKPQEAIKKNIHPEIIDFVYLAKEERVYKCIKNADFYNQLNDLLYDYERISKTKAVAEFNITSKNHVLNFLVYKAPISICHSEEFYDSVKALKQSYDELYEKNIGTKLARIIDHSLEIEKEKKTLLTKPEQLSEICDIEKKLLVIGDFFNELGNKTKAEISSNIKKNISQEEKHNFQKSFENTKQNSKDVLHGSWSYCKSNSEMDICTNQKYFDDVSEFIGKINLDSQISLELIQLMKENLGKYHNSFVSECQDPNLASSISGELFLNSTAAEL